MHSYQLNGGVHELIVHVYRYRASSTQDPTRECTERNSLWVDPARAGWVRCYIDDGVALYGREH